MRQMRSGVCLVDAFVYQNLQYVGVYAKSVVMPTHLAFLMIKRLGLGYEC